MRFFGQLRAHNLMDILSRYFDAIEERRLDELRAQEEVIHQFMMKRAAIVLQRAWRSVAERKRKMRGRRGGRRAKGKK